MSKVLADTLKILLLVCFPFLYSASENTTTVEPPPAVPKYIIKNGTDVCFVGEFNIQFTVPYFNQNGDQQSKIFYINASNPWIQSNTSICMQDKTLVDLGWLNYRSWFLQLLFQRTDSNLFSLTNVQLDYTLLKQLFPDSNETEVSYSVQNNQSQFSCSIGSYYSCISKQTLKLTTDKSSYPEVYLSFSDFRAEAFRSGPSDNYVGYATSCNADYVPNKAVPIAVGITLAVLIIIALLTFILGSRFRQSGYSQI